MSDTAEGELLEEQRGAIRIVTINRPQARNAMNAAVTGGIGRAMTDADADPDVHAVVLTATGTQAFCSGMDLREFARGRSAGGERGGGRVGAAGFQRWLREGITKPVVCAAPGTAVAGGMELLLACDLVVVAEGAQLGLPEVKRALLPAGGGVFLARRIPLAVALELTMTGDSIDARRALELGLVNRVVPAEAVLEEAIGLAERIAALSPLAVAVIKRLVRYAATAPPEDVWALQAELVPLVFGSDDAREGAAAFVEKRSPVWTGRAPTPAADETPS